MFAHAPKIYAFAVQDRQTQVSNFSSDNQGGNSIMKKFMAVLAMAVMVAFAAPAFAATNPFMDVPQGHWSYDAVGLLASRGIVSGYPDGAFKGAQPATRYEMASVVARALVTVDAEKASKQDLELLKKLVMEFKDELDALGVKVDSLDKRVAVLEENLGGWKLYGELYFDAEFYDSDDTTGNAGLDSDFGYGRARFYLEKQISETTSMLVRIDSYDPRGEFTWDRLYVDTKLPWDIDFRFGRFDFDWEADLGLYDPYTIDNDATFGDWVVDGFQFVKRWDNFSFTAIVGRNNDDYAAADNAAYVDSGNYMTYAAKLGYDAENWMLGAMGYWLKGDNGDGTEITDALGNVTGILPNADINTYGIYAGYSFTPSIQLKGAYYFQDIDDNFVSERYGAIAGKEDSPTSWKAILDIKQDLLKFTALWIEYAQQDNKMYNNPFDNGTAEIWNIIANQQWNDQWSTYVRYWRADWDNQNVDDTENWTVGVRYQYTPAIQFKLEYDTVDYGTNGDGLYSGDDNIIRFRTTVTF